MVKFLNHDALAGGLFNRYQSVTTPNQAAWADVLVNTTESLLLVCDRMSEDFSATLQKLRKPWNAAAIET